MNTENILDKGNLAEEVVRNYFRELGYYVVRGIPFDYVGQEVTDVDLWVYKKTSALTREILIVDIKDKKSPGAMERIFWTRGLVSALDVDGGVVATSDKRTAIRKFGLKNDIKVLDGNFLMKLKTKRGLDEYRLAEEKLLEKIDPDGLGKMKGNWKDNYLQSKSILLSHLDFSGCNTFLKKSSNFIEELIVDNQRREIATRLLYINISFFLVALDYIQSDLLFLGKNIRKKALREGFLHGVSGSKGTQNIIDKSINLIKAYLPNGQETARILEENVKSTINDIPVDILVEFFSKVGNSTYLFENAIKFENMAFSREVISPNETDSDLGAIIGVMLDFSEIERKRFFDSF